MVGEPEQLPRSTYVAGSAAVQKILDRNVQVNHRIGSFSRDVENLRCAVASEEEDVVAQLDGSQRLRDLYLEPGVQRRYRPDQLAAVITETVLAAGQAVSDETAALRAHYFLPNESPD